jgi:hypothetical protein
VGRPLPGRIVAPEPPDTIRCGTDIIPCVHVRMIRILITCVSRFGLLTWSLAIGYWELASNDTPAGGIHPRAHLGAHLSATLRTHLRIPVRVHLSATARAYLTAQGRVLVPAQETAPVSAHVRVLVPALLGVLVPALLKVLAPALLRALLQAHGTAHGPAPGLGQTALRLRAPPLPFLPARPLGALDSSNPRPLDHSLLCLTAEQSSVAFCDGD